MKNPRTPYHDAQITKRYPFEGPDLLAREFCWSRKLVDEIAVELGIEREQPKQIQRYPAQYNNKNHWT